MGREEDTTCVVVTFDGKGAKATSFTSASLTVHLGDPPHRHSTDAALMIVSRVGHSSQ